MTTNALGVNVPVGTDSFDPAGDMTALADSLAGRIVVPVANTTERNALASSLAPSSSAPLIVYRADAPSGAEIEITENGSDWRTLLSATFAEPANATNPTMGSSASFQKVYFTALNAGAGATDFTLTGGAVAVNATGRYDIKVSASFSANATGSRGVNIGINGGTSGGRGTLLVPASSVGLTYMTVSDERNLTAGDTAQINLLQNSGATLNVNGWMSIRRVA